MEIQLPSRVDAVAWFLGAALVAMAVSFVGGAVSLAAWPVMKFIETHANPFVSPSATILNCATVWLILLALRFASARGAKRPTSIFSRSQAVFTCARVVSLVYLAQLVVGLIASEIRWLFQVPVANATQLDLFSTAGRVFMTLVLPAVGIIALVAMAPRVLEATRRTV